MSVTEYQKYANIKPNLKANRWTDFRFRWMGIPFLFNFFFAKNFYCTRWNQKPVLFYVNEREFNARTNIHCKIDFESLFVFCIYWVSDEVRNIRFGIGSFHWLWMSSFNTRSVEKGFIINRHHIEKCFNWMNQVLLSNSYTKYTMVLTAIENERVINLVEGELRITQK